MCSNQTEDTDLNASNMIAGANESTTIKHMSCKCKCKFDGRTFKSKQK